MSQTKKALREALDEIALRFVSGNKIQIDSARISRSEWLLLQAALSLPETQGEPFVCDSRVCHAPSNRCYGCPHYHGKASVCSYAPPSQPVDVFASQRFDCHYDGDITRCDKDCAQIGACKRRTQDVVPSVANFPASLRSPFNACMFKEQCIEQAEKAAAPSSQPAQGWRLVPVEPTQAMMEAAAPFPEHLRAEHPNPDDPWHEGMFIATKCDQLAARTTYRAMLAAAPAAPTQAKPTNGEGA